MSLNVTTPDVMSTDAPRDRAGSRPARAPIPQVDVRSSSGDALVYWLPTSAVIAAMAAAYDAADQAAEAAVASDDVTDDLQRQTSTHEGSPKQAQAVGPATDTDDRAGPSFEHPSPEADTSFPETHGVSDEAAVFFNVNGPTDLAALALLAAQGADVPENLIAAAATGRVLRGTDGDDVLFGGAGDVLLGGAGDDTLIAVSHLLGGAFGGDGFDQLIFETNEGATGTFADSSIEIVVGSAFDDELSFEGARQSVVLDGGAGDDVLIGGEGDDTIWGGDGEDTLLGLAGDDTFYFDTSDALVDGGDGIDTVIFTDVGAITFDLAASNVEIAYGGDGNDVLSANGAETLSAIFGGGGDDIVTGGSGFDTAIYYGDRARYDVVTQDDGLVLVTDTLGFEGVDTLSGIEQLRFGDGDFVL